MYINKRMLQMNWPVLPYMSIDLAGCIHSQDVILILRPSQEILTDLPHLNPNLSCNQSHFVGPGLRVAHTGFRTLCSWGGLWAHNPSACTSECWDSKPMCHYSDLRGAGNWTQDFVQGGQASQHLRYIPSSQNSFSGEASVNCLSSCCEGTTFPSPHSFRNRRTIACHSDFISHSEC